MKCDLCGKKVYADDFKSYDAVEGSKLCPSCYGVVTNKEDERENLEANNNPNTNNTNGQLAEQNPAIFVITSPIIGLIIGALFGTIFRMGWYTYGVMYIFAVMGTVIGVLYSIIAYKRIKSFIPSVLAIIMCAILVSTVIGLNR